MTTVVFVVRCAACSRVLKEKPSLPEAKRKPCPACGSLGRAVQQDIGENLSVYDGIRTMWKYLVGNRIKSTETITGWFSSVRYGIIRKFRLADRRNDLYQEKIWTKDGTLVHECEEPLSKHFGHGSDKPKQP